MRTVVKVGGRVIEDGSALEALARTVSELDGDVVLVHGGGSSISAWQERAGLEPNFVDGLRVTTPEGMEVTSMVLSGWMNKRVVAALIGAGRPAVGISGEDGRTLQATWKERLRLGEVGRIVSVDPTAVQALLGAGFLPVVSPVSAGPEGVPLNVNADEAAIALAVALRADRLLLVSDVPGVLVDGRTAPALGAAECERLLARGVVTGGMGVKVVQALEAAVEGVEVRIGGTEILGDAVSGTRILPPAVRAAVA